MGEGRKPIVQTSALEELDQRSREIFRTIVESYLETGDPLGSRTSGAAIVAGRFAGDDP